MTQLGGWQGGDVPGLGVVIVSWDIIVILYIIFTASSLTWSVPRPVTVREGRLAEDQTENHCLRTHKVHVEIWPWSDLLSHCGWL